MKNLAVVAEIEFYDSISLSDAVQTAALISDTLGCPIRVKRRLKNYQAEIKVEVTGRIEKPTLKIECGCSLREGKHFLGDHKQRRRNDRRQS